MLPNFFFDISSPTPCIYLNFFINLETQKLFFAVSCVSANKEHMDTHIVMIYLVQIICGYSPIMISYFKMQNNSGHNIYCMYSFNSLRICPKDRFLMRRQYVLSKSSSALSFHNGSLWSQ